MVSLYAVKEYDGTPTVSVIVVLTVSDPEVPLTVTGYDPAGTLLPTVNKRPLLNVVDAGENEAVTPLGRPETDRFTLPLKPF